MSFQNRTNDTNVMSPMRAIGKSAVHFVFTSNFGVLDCEVKNVRHFEFMNFVIYLPGRPAPRTQNLGVVNRESLKVHSG